MEYLVGESPAKYRTRHPDRDEWLELAWPATRLTDDHRRMLTIMANETKQPMTQILVEAVERMYDVFQDS
jgi:hypothetical protein